MGEYIDFNKLRDELAVLPESPDENENAIEYAQRLQTIVAMHPREVQELIASDCKGLLEQNFGFDFYGRQIAVHALRAFVYNPYLVRNAPPALEYNSPVEVKGFSDRFSIRPLIQEVMIGLEIARPKVFDADGSPLMELPLEAPVTVPVIRIWTHET